MSAAEGFLFVQCKCGWSGYFDYGYSSITDWMDHLWDAANKETLIWDEANKEALKCDSYSEERRNG